MIDRERIEEGFEKYHERVTRTHYPEPIHYFKAGADWMAMEIEKVITTAVCKKGCGEVELERRGDDLLCSHCGEEFYYEIPNAQHKLALKILPNKADEE